MPISKDKPCIEITVRRFYTSDEADFTAQSRFDVAVIGERPDWETLMDGMVMRCAQQHEGAPLSNVREMTVKEANAYRAANDGDAETSN